jgi:hypothetical protein
MRLPRPGEAYQRQHLNFRCILVMPSPGGPGIGNPHSRMHCNEMNGMRPRASLPDGGGCDLGRMRLLDWGGWDRSGRGPAGTRGARS